MTERHEATIQRHERHGSMHAIVSKPCNCLDACQSWRGLSWLDARHRG